MGTKSLEFNATTAIKTFTVTFKVNGTDYTTRTVKYNKSVNMKEITNPSNYQDNEHNYTFEKWEGNTTNIKKDTIVTAKFKSSTRYYNVKFVDFDERVLKEVNNATYGSKVNAPKNPTRANYTFTGWSNNDYLKVEKDNIVVTAQYTVNQIGIRAEVKPTMMLQFQINGTYNIKDYINVYKVYADGKEELTLDYTVSGFSTSSVVDHKPLIIIQNGFPPYNSLTYNVINEKAYQTKFEINYPGKNYRKTKNKLFECKENCDSVQNTNSVGLNYSVIEIIEHYDEAIEIDSVNVLYKNSSNYTNVYVTDMVRWSHRSGFILHDYYNPVYIGKIVESSDFWNGNTYTDIMNDEKVIDKVNVVYSREGYGKYVVVFKYNKDSKTFTPIDEYKTK